MTSLQPQTSHASNAQTGVITNDFDAFIFDMDGTLLDTLPDLVVVTNHAMEHFGYPTHTQDEIIQMVGKGAHYLMAQALNIPEEESLVDEVLAYWKSIYPTYGHKLTQPYPAIVDIAQTLKTAGKKTAILSNKYDQGVKDLAERYFHGLFDIVLGEGPVPRKPDPTGLRTIMQQLDVEPSRCAYFGDSDGDMKVAHAAGAYAVGVTWGYQSIDRLKKAGAELLIHDTHEILTISR